MTRPAYYNEIDPVTAQWLRNLIVAGHIAPGDVDTRSIEDVRPDDLIGYGQCHFFAGLGVWSYAFRRVGIPDDAPIWSGSCPCQPFSAAGAGDGLDDQRHLWPHWNHLVRERRPAAVVGEQVASKAAEEWIDLVCDDLGSLGYTTGAVAFPSAGVGAPHIRDRLYWLAYADRRVATELARQWHRPGAARGAGAAGTAARCGAPAGSPWAQGDGGMGHAHHAGRQRLLGSRDMELQRGAGPLRPAAAAGVPGIVGDTECIGPQGSGDTGVGAGVGQPRAQPAGAGADIGLADTQGGGLGEQRRALEPGHVRHADGSGDEPGSVADTQQQRQHGSGAARAEGEPECGRGDAAGCADAAGWLADADSGRLPQEGRGPLGRIGEPRAGEAPERPGPANGFWRDADWLLCRDGRWRPVEAGTFPLAHGIAGRVGSLRAYGNAINAEAAVAFIECIGEVLCEQT